VFARSRYIEWATTHYGKVEYDLATSGIPAAAWSELEVPVPAIDDAAGYARLRAAIAKYNQVTDAEVVPTLGTSGAIFLAYAAVLGPGDEIIVETPGYEPLTRTAEGLGAVVRTFERREEDGFRIIPELVAARVTPRTRLIAVTNLHNPSGAHADRRTLRELALVAEARSAYLLVDEVYAPFDDLPEDGVFRGGARSIAPNVIAIASLTKCYGLGLHRVGWLLGPPEVVSAAEAAIVSSAGHFPASHANLGAAAFDGIGALSRRAKALMAGKRAIAAEWAATHPKIRWSSPREGLFGLVTVPGEGDLLEKIEQTAKDAGVLVAAGTFFGAPRSFRLSWATCDDKRFREGLSRLAPLVS
jgi:aspartate/methionine/tyrosine aminotransferase